MFVYVRRVCHTEKLDGNSAYLAGIQILSSVQLNHNHMKIWILHECCFVPNLTGDSTLSSVGVVHPS